MNVTQQDRKKKKFSIFSPTFSHNIVPRSTRVERLNSAKGTNKYVKNMT